MQNTQEVCTNGVYHKLTTIISISAGQVATPIHWSDPRIDQNLQQKLGTYHLKHQEDFVRTIRPVSELRRRTPGLHCFSSRRDRRH